MEAKFRRLELRQPGPLPYDADPAYFILGRQAEVAAALGVDMTLDVDWAKEFVIIVQRGECRTGGYAVAVDRIETGPRPGELTVTVRRTDPGPDDFVTMVVTYPKCAVAVKRAGLPGVRSVVFVDSSGKALRTVDVSL